MKNDRSKLDIWELILLRRKYKNYFVLGLTKFLKYFSTIIISMIEDNLHIDVSYFSFKNRTTLVSSFSSKNKIITKENCNFSVNFHLKSNLIWFLLFFCFTRRSVPSEVFKYNVLFIIWSIKRILVMGSIYTLMPLHAWLDCFIFRRFYTCWEKKTTKKYNGFNKHGCKTRK